MANELKNDESVENKGKLDSLLKIVAQFKNQHTEEIRRSRVLRE